MIQNQQSNQEISRTSIHLHFPRPLMIDGLNPLGITYRAIWQADQRRYQAFGNDQVDDRYVEINSNTNPIGTGWTGFNKAMNDSEDPRLRRKLGG